MSSLKIWKPFENILSRFQNNNYAAIILNTPIHFESSNGFIINLWNQATLRMTVDGGTERWLSYIRSNNIKDVKKPDLITGDMDSLPEDVIKCFLNDEKGPMIIETPDQNETDFTKALRELNNYCNWRNYKIDIVYVIVENSGRLDHIIANINSLFKAMDFLSECKIYLLASNSLTWLLDKGKHVINVPPILVQNQEWCSLLPIGCPSHVTTTGLKWNLDNQKLEFGRIVSSSNTYKTPTITIDTENPIIWSMGVCIDTFLL